MEYFRLRLFFTYGATATFTLHEATLAMTAS